MTADGVHPTEMPAPDDLDERAVEAFLTGHSVAAGEAGLLSAFAEDLRMAAGGPPPAPSPQLAALLAEGFSVDNHEVAAAAPIAADGADAPVVGRPTQRRRMMTISGFLAALATKLAGLGVAAKVALGATLATASAATAGAAGVLPEPAQRAVATVVNATPFHIPDGSEDGDAVTDVTDVIPPAGGDATGTGDDATGEDATGEDATGAGDTHGACVSAVAREAPRGPGGVHGKAVSSAAKTCPKATDPDDEPTTTTSTTIASDDGVAGATDRGQGNGGQGNADSGPGNSGGQGNANSGSGNSGGRGK